MKSSINEELTRAEIRSMIDSMVSDYLKERDFEKKVKEITVDVVEKFFRTMYNKRNFWKSELKNG